MICVYDAACTDFSNNGLGPINPSSCQVTETLNGEYELTVIHPIDEIGKWQRLVEGNIVRAPVPAAMTPQINLRITTPTESTLIYRIDTSHGTTPYGTLRLRAKASVHPPRSSRPIRTAARLSFSTILILPGTK